MTDPRCPHCGALVGVTLTRPDHPPAPGLRFDGEAAAQYSDARTRAKDRRRLPGDPSPVLGRPFPVFRGEGVRA